MPTYPFQWVTLPSTSLLFSRPSVSLHQFRTRCSKSRRYRRWWLVESLAHFQLCLIDLLQALNPLVLRDLLQILWSAVEKRNADMCLFERSNIVCTVTGHERDVPQRLEGREDELLLRGGDASVDPGVLHEYPPRWFPFELFHSRSSHADVVLGKKALIDWLRRVDGNIQRLFHVPPFEV